MLSLPEQTSVLDQFETSMGDHPEKPPTYEESAKNTFGAASTSSGGSSGSIQISLEKLPQTGSASGSTISVDQVQDELTALQRAQIHLYKRLQHVKSQTYAALALVLLMAGIIVIFLATYHQDKTPIEVNHRTGKALVGGGGSVSSSSASLLSSNAIVTDEDTEALLKHLSKIVTSTTRASEGTTTKTPTTEDVLQIFKLKEILRSDSGLEAPDARQENISDSSIVKVASTILPTSTTELTMTTSTSTTTTTTSTVEAETEEPETVKPKLQDTYNISIVVHSATVPNMDYLPLGRASDTYCDVFIDDVLIGSTPIIDNNNNPNWHYLLPRSYKVRKESSIRVDLLDRDHLKKDHIGGVVILVGDLVNTSRVNRPVKFFHGRGDVWVTVKLV